MTKEEIQLLEMLIEAMFYKRLAPPPERHLWKQEIEKIKSRLQPKEEKK